MEKLDIGKQRQLESETFKERLQEYMYSKKMATRMESFVSGFMIGIFMIILFTNLNSIYANTQ